MGRCRARALLLQRPFRQSRWCPAVSFRRPGEHCRGRRAPVARAVPIGGSHAHSGSTPVRAYSDAGFTDIALIQIGGESQDVFLKEAAEPLPGALRDADWTLGFGISALVLAVGGVTWVFVGRSRTTHHVGNHRRQT